MVLLNVFIFDFHSTFVLLLLLLLKEMFFILLSCFTFSLLLLLVLLERMYAATLHGTPKSGVLFCFVCFVCDARYAFCNRGSERDVRGVHGKPSTGRGA